MQRRNYFIPIIFIFAICWFSIFSFSLPAQATTNDPFIRRYFDARQPVEIPLDEKGNTRAFTGEDFVDGKALFEQSCVNCHVGGITVQYPTVSLSLDALKGATPPRDHINNLVAYMRDPVSYDGTDFNFWCRQVSESWMSEAEIEKLAAFILRAAEKVPNWGANSNQ